MLILPWTKCQRKDGDDKIESDITVIIFHDFFDQNLELIAIGAIQKLMRRVGCETYDVTDEDINHICRTYTISYQDKFHKEIMKDLAEKDHFHYEMMIIEE